MNIHDATMMIFKPMCLSQRKKEQCRIRYRIVCKKRPGDVIFSKSTVHKNHEM